MVSESYSFEICFKDRTSEIIREQKMILGSQLALQQTSSSCLRSAFVREALICNGCPERQGFQWSLWSRQLQTGKVQIQSVNLYEDQNMFPCFAVLQSYVHVFKNGKTKIGTKILISRKEK